VLCIVQGWSRDAIQLVRLVVIVVGALNALNMFISTATGILTWHGGPFTKADLTDMEGRLKDSMVQSEQRLEREFTDVKDSLKTVVTWPYLLGAVAAFVAGRRSK
jgi:hypothetical protein